MRSLGSPAGEIGLLGQHIAIEDGVLERSARNCGLFAVVLLPEPSAPAINQN
jgi:hypothetical protein